MKIRFILPLVAFSLLCVGAVHGAQFRVLGLNALPGDSSLEFVGADGVHRVDVSIAYCSPGNRIPPGGVVNFYDRAPGADEEKKPLLTVRFPENSGDVIVLLEGGVGGVPLRYGLIDDTERAFPDGSVYIMNFMEDTVMVKLGQKVVRVDSGDRQMVPVVDGAKQPFKGGVKFATQINGDAQVFSMNSWYLLPSMKIVCVIYPDVSGVPQIRRIRLT